MARNFRLLWGMGPMGHIGGSSRVYLIGLAKMSVAQDYGYFGSFMGHFGVW